MSEQRSARQKLEEILQFLYGADEMDGVTFGERPEGKPPFWWRSKLREAVMEAFAENAAMVREECEKAVSEVAREWFEHDGRMSEGGKAVCAAIRRKD